MRREPRTFSFTNFPTITSQFIHQSGISFTPTFVGVRPHAFFCLPSSLVSLLAPGLAFVVSVRCHPTHPPAPTLTISATNQLTPMTYSSLNPLVMLLERMFESVPTRPQTCGWAGRRWLRVRGGRGSTFLPAARGRENLKISCSCVQLRCLHYLP